MDNLDLIEAAKGGPFRFQHHGEVYLMPDPANLSFQAILAILQIQHVPHPPSDMPEWKRALLFERWAAHYDLPDFQSAQRLAYVLDRYRSALVYDLQTFAGADIGVLWRARRWRTALDLIDHLPGHCWYSTAVAGDEEHAKMLAESIAARAAEGEQTTSGPSLHAWTPEVAAITQATDEIRRLTYVTAAVGGDKNAKPPEPLPRPHTPLEAAVKSAKFKARQEKHQSIVKRVLPHKS